MTTRATIVDDDRFALYEHAHHDFWWAKAQEWNVANWGLLLLASNVGIARTLIPENYLGFRTAWLFWALNLAIPLVATYYLSRLHIEIVHNRRVYRWLESQTGVKRLRAQLQAERLQAADETSDYKRGGVLLVLMSVVFAMGSGFAMRFLGGSPTAAIIVGVVVFLFDAGLLFFTIRRLKRPSGDTVSAEPV